MWKLLIRLFKKQIYINAAAPSVPEAFGYDVKKYDLLVNEMVNLIKPDDRITSFHEYATSGLLLKYNLDLATPRDSLLIGYAFATAIFLQRHLSMQDAANEVLEIFYPKKMSN